MTAGNAIDLCVIGAGSAGLSVATMAGIGARVALIERDRTGGECINAGCVPSKALLAAAQRRMRPGRLAPSELTPNRASTWRVGTPTCIRPSRRLRHTTQSSVWSASASMGSVPTRALAWLP